VPHSGRAQWRLGRKGRKQLDYWVGRVGKGPQARWGFWKGTGSCFPSLAYGLGYLVPRAARTRNPSGPLSL
jgi:hypothetical protein